MTSHMVLLVVTLLFLFAGLGAVITGGYGNTWFTSSRIEVGLWKRCVDLVLTEACEVRGDLFHFKDSADITLVLLIGSAGLCFLALLSTLCMSCIQNSCSWRCCALIVSLMAFLSATLSLGAVGYNEYTNANAYKLFFDHGWANIITWVGAGLQFIGSILAYILLCVAPVRVVDGQVIQPGAYNRGFEMR